MLSAAGDRAVCARARAACVQAAAPWKHWHELLSAEAPLAALPLAPPVGHWALANADRPTLHRGLVARAASYLGARPPFSTLRARSAVDNLLCACKRQQTQTGFSNQLVHYVFANWPGS